MTDYDYRAAGVRCRAMSKESATDCFWSIADQYGVVDGAYGSWDMFWTGYYGI